MRRVLHSTWNVAMGHLTAYYIIAEDININTVVQNIARLPYSPRMGEIPTLLPQHQSHRLPRRQKKCIDGLYRELVE
jgi:hypothetical protein